MSLLLRNCSILIGLLILLAISYVLAHAGAGLAPPARFTPPPFIAGADACPGPSPISPRPEGQLRRPGKTIWLLLRHFRHEHVHQLLRLLVGRQPHYFVLLPGIQLYEKAFEGFLIGPELFVLGADAAIDQPDQPPPAVHVLA